MSAELSGKRVLQLVTTPYNKPKGSSLRVDSLVQKLAKENTVDVVTYPLGENVGYENVQMYRVFKGIKWELGISEISLKKLLLDFGIFVKAFGLLLRNRYDIVHCEDFEAAGIGSVCSLFFRKPKYVYDFHNSIVDNLEIVGKKGGILKIAKSIEKFVLSRFDMVILNWKMYENHPQIKDKEYFLLYDKSDIESKEYTIPTEKPYLVYSGNYKEYQGVENFLETYAKVNASYDVVLIGNITEKVRLLIEDLNLGEKIHCTGLLDIKESNYLIKNSLFPLIPRISGKQPGLKMIHHIMLGKVSIASRIPANTEYLNDANAILYSNDDELLKILKSIDLGEIKEEDYQKRIEECQKEISEIWSYEYFVNNYSRIFA